MRRLTQQPPAPASNASADKALQGQVGSGGLGGVAATGRLHRRGSLRRWLDGTGVGGFDRTPMQTGRRRRDGTGVGVGLGGAGAGRRRAVDGAVCGGGDGTGAFAGAGRARATAAR